jgi:hypothetical protein
MLNDYIEWLFRMFGRIFWTVTIFFGVALFLGWLFG